MMKKININVILILLVVLLMVSLFFFNKMGEYGGLDGEVEVEIIKIDLSYELWFEFFYELKSGEIESLLFMF